MSKESHLVILVMLPLALCSKTRVVFRFLMIDFYHAYINETNLCGKDGFVVWNSGNSDFGHCFQDLVFLLPVQVTYKQVEARRKLILLQAAMGIISAYYLGFQASQWFLRTRTQKYILLLRSFVTLILALLPIIKTMALYSLDRKAVTNHGEVRNNSEQYMDGSIQP